MDSKLFLKLCGCINSLARTGKLPRFILKGGPLHYLVSLQKCFVLYYFVTCCMLLKSPSMCQFFWGCTLFMTAHICKKRSYWATLDIFWATQHSRTPNTFFCFNFIQRGLVCIGEQTEVSIKLKCRCKTIHDLEFRENYKTRFSYVRIFYVKRQIEGSILIVRWMSWGVVFKLIHCYQNLNASRNLTFEFCIYTLKLPLLISMIVKQTNYTCHLQNNFF